MGRTIVIASGKGGVGKSTVTCWLGAALCSINKRVLLIDMDEGLRSLDLMLDVSSHTVFDVSDILNGNCNANQAVLPVARCSNLFLLPAPIKLGSIENPEKMKILCDKLSEVFDYVLIDSPAGIGNGFDIAASAADSALVVVNPDPVSVRDGASVAQLLRKKQINSIKLIINKINTKLMLKGIFLNIDEIIDSTGLQLIAAIPTDENLISSSASGEIDFTTTAFEAFKRLALRLEGKNLPLINLLKIT